MPLVDTAMALRLLGKREEIHPHDAVAFIYPSRAVAADFAMSNLEIHGHDTYSVAVEGGVIGVVDLRHCFSEVTDPARPDGWWGGE